jgi:hypothetical protein
MLESSMSNSEEQKRTATWTANLGHGKSNYSVKGVSSHSGDLIAGPLDHLHEVVDVLCCVLVL